MRSTDEQLREIMKRAEVVKEKRTIRKSLRMNALSACICAILLTVASFYIPRLNSAPQENGMHGYGSLLLAAPYIGYVVVGILAFALGVCVTLLCIRLKELKEKERERK